MGQTVKFKLRAVGIPPWFTASDAREYFARVAQSQGRTVLSAVRVTKSARGRVLSITGTHSVRHGRKLNGNDIKALLSQLVYVRGEIDAEIIAA